MSTIQNSEKKQEQIRKKYLSLKKKEEKIHQDRITLIESCNHPNLNIENHKSNNDANSHYTYYWSNATCPDCGMKLHFAESVTVEDVRIFLEKSNEQDLN